MPTERKVNRIFSLDKKLHGGNFLSKDTGLIKQGQKYSDLKQTYVLFISTIDQFGYDEPVYEIISYIKDHPEYTFDDRRKEVVYNLSACDNFLLDCHTDVAREQRENILFCRLKGR